MAKFQSTPPPAIDVNEFRKVVESRRSIRRFEDTPIPDEILNDCLDMALLAPNSSNMQPWTFYVVRSAELRKKMAVACLSQNAAKTAPVLIAVVARTDTWKRASKAILDNWPNGEPPPIVKQYYSKTAHINYSQGPLGSFGLAKKGLSTLAGFTRVVPTGGPMSPADMKVWAAKSTALAAAQLMLALRAHGYDSCPMEGYDMGRVRKLLKVPKDGFPIMIIAAGKRRADGIYHDRYRLKREDVVVEL